MIKKKILIVDSSSVVRRYLIKLFQDAGYEVKSAKNKEEVLSELSSTHFSLLILDSDMPNSATLDILTEVMQQKPTRVLLLSSQHNTANTMQALNLGAIDSILKPHNNIDIAKISHEILSKVENALKSMPNFLQKSREDFKKHDVSIDANIAMKFVLIGSSTGGPRLIEQICKTLPENYPHALCVVQHMPTDFTANFAKRLNSLSKVEVIEAESGIELQAGRVIIAKGGKHLHFKKKLKSITTLLTSNINERFFTPSVDEMFLSAAEVIPAKHILAIELTGIGDDGADGMVALRKKGAYTIAESEKTAIVYGMPKEAAIRGGAQKVLDFNDILDEIIHYGQ